MNEKLLLISTLLVLSVRSEKVLKQFGQCNGKLELYMEQTFESPDDDLFFYDLNDPVVCYQVEYDDPIISAKVVIENLYDVYLLVIPGVNGNGFKVGLKRFNQVQ